MTTAWEPPSVYGFLMSGCVSLRIRRVAVKNPLQHPNPAGWTLPESA
jgi:hypothetical protein